jgi:hypothetical protein
MSAEGAAAAFVVQAGTKGDRPGWRRGRTVIFFGGWPTSADRRSCKFRYLHIQTSAMRHGAGSNAARRGNCGIYRAGPDTADKFARAIQAVLCADTLMAS